MRFQERRKGYSMISLYVQLYYTSGAESTKNSLIYPFSLINYHSSTIHCRIRRVDTLSVLFDVYLYLRR